MRLVCEDCGILHIDEGEFATKPHHTHACQHCGLVWRPAVVCTVGVQFLPGFRNGPVALRMFVRKSNSHEAGIDYETCATCGKHIRHHYGFGSKSSDEYRCDPKDGDAPAWGATP